MGLFDLFKKQDSDKNNSLAKPLQHSNDLIENTEFMLEEVNIDLTKADAIELPFAQLSAMGGSIASMLPSLRTISNKVTVENKGLYQAVFPDGIEGQLAKKDGMNLGTIMNKHGIVGQVRWKKADPQTITTTTIAPINPATIAMAAALSSIDKKLDEVLEMEKQILSFLEEDKEAKIEGDLKTLTTIFKEFKFNWDNDTYIATHHQIAADIKRDAEANIIFYQKQVAEALKGNSGILLQQGVDKTQTALIKKFKYYRLSLYLYSFASFLEVMLQGHYEQAYIEQVRQGVVERNNRYHDVHKTCTEHLKKLTSSTVQHTVLKTLGSAGKAVGGFLGSIPLIKDGSVDEWLTKSGNDLEQTGENIGKETLKQFETVGDSGCDVFIDNLAYVDHLFNETQKICIGKEAVYLIKDTNE